MANCYKCRLLYPSERSLDTHLKICLDEIEFSCDECQKIITGKHNLQNHKKTHKVGECSECGIVIPLNSLKSHKKRH